MQQVEKRSGISRHARAEFHSQSSSAPILGVGIRTQHLTHTWVMLMVALLEIKTLSLFRLYHPGFSFVLPCKAPTMVGLKNNKILTSYE